MDKEDGSIRCQIMWQLDQDKKYDDVTEHLLSGCLNCVTNSKKRFNGKEMLFPNAPPPWIKIPESEAKNPDAWKNYHKKRVHTQMTQEEFEQFLVDSDMTDTMLCWEIAKFKRIERVVAWPMVRDIRKKQKEIRMEQEKKDREQRKKESEAKKEAEKLKKMDEKRKIAEKKQIKDDEKQEYLNKMAEEEKLLVEVLGEEESDGELMTSQDSEAANDSESSEIATEKSRKNPKFLEPISQKKEFNLRHAMPWSPSAYDLLCSDLRSIIDHSSQKRVIAMCQSLLFTGSLRHPGNRFELKDLRKACESEYDTLAAAALEHARENACHPIDFSTERAIRYCLNQFKRREPRDEFTHYLFKSPVFTVENVEIVSGIRSEGQSLIPKVEKVLKVSNVNSRLDIPDISKKCEIKTNYGRPTPKSRLIDDDVAFSMIKSSPQVTVVTDATTICHLITPSWESRDYEFGCPIDVKEVRIDGTTKKIVIVSKPMPSNTISRASIQRKALKQLLRNQFLHDHPKKPKSRPQPPNSKPFTSSQESSESMDDAPESSSTAGTSSSQDFLDDILAEMQQKDANSESAIRGKPEDSTYQYAIFRIGDARILVRSNSAYSIQELGEKKHSFLENLKKVTFEPRIEYLSNGGAMELGSEEWIWNYTKAIFKMSESHLLYRSNYKMDHILQVDGITMRIDMQEPPPDALGILSSRSVMMERMIAQLESLEPGEYMAFQEKNRPIQIVPKCDSDQRGGVSIEAMRIKRDDCQKLSDHITDSDYFHGFCRDVPLQWQIVQGRAPQMLLAKDSPTSQFMPSKNSRDKLQRKKSNFKRKIQEKEAEREEAKRNKTIDLDDPNLYADFTNPSVAPMDYIKKPPSKFRGGRGRGQGGGFRGRPRGGGGVYRGRGRGRGGPRGGASGGQSTNADGSGPSSSSVEYPEIL